jgi:hypothetical protein
MKTPEQLAEDKNLERVTQGTHASTPEDGMNGAFHIKLGYRKVATCIISDGEGWEHVSAHVRCYNKKGKRIVRTPSWAEMCVIKDTFFKPDEVAMQIHPKEEDYVNMHHHVLHIWRPTNQEIPTPPKIFV